MKISALRPLILIVTIASLISGCALRLPWKSGSNPPVQETISNTTQATAMVALPDSTQPSANASQPKQSEPILPTPLPKSMGVASSNTLALPSPPEDIWSRLRNGFGIENADQNPKTLSQFEKWYGDRPTYFERLSERAYWFLPYILAEVEKRGMPSEVALIPAVESTFQPEATSRSKAAGIWQFMGATGRRFGLDQNWWVDERRDLVQSTQAALDYLEYLSEEFNGDWELAFAAYNAGEGRVSRAVKKNIKNNRPPFYRYLDLSKETRQYLPKLFAIRNIIADPDKYGIELKHIPNELTLETIDAQSQTDLSVAASLVDIPMDQLSFFNQNYKRGVTHPSGPHTITLPKDFSEPLRDKLAKLSVRERLRWARHQVRKGEYLGKIARKHSVTVDSIMIANSLSSNLIKPGQELRIPLSTGRYNYSKNKSKPIKPKDGDTIYIVQSGDSLWTIAKQANTKLSNLMAWNTMNKNTRLYPGQSLIISR